MRFSLFAILAMLLLVPVRGMAATEDLSIGSNLFVTTPDTANLRNFCQETQITGEGGTFDTVSCDVGIKADQVAGPKRIYGRGDYPFDAYSNNPRIGLTWSTNNTENNFVTVVKVFLVALTNGTNLNSENYFRLTGPTFARALTNTKGATNFHSFQAGCVIDGKSIEGMTQPNSKPTCCTNTSCGGSPVVIVIDDITYIGGSPYTVYYYSAGLTWDK